MGLFSASPQTSTSTNTFQQQSQINPAFSSIWGDIAGTGIGLANSWINAPPQFEGATSMADAASKMVAGPQGLMQGYFNQAGGGIGTPDYSGLMGSYGNIYNQAGTQVTNPAGINLPSNFNFQPGALNFNNPFAGGTPQVTAPGGVSGLASYYQVNPQQVQAQQVSAPGAINPITGLPQLINYQMGPAQTVNAMPLQGLSMQAAPNVAPIGQVGTQGFNSGIAAALMSPYTQNVVQAQLDQANVQYQQQLEQQRAQAAQAGAFGGSRQAVEAANQAIGYQQLASQIEATGLQNAYQQAQQQFNTQQAMGLQAGQFNVQTGLQASLANQQAQQQANLQNLSAALQTQGLQAQTGLQASLANQQAGLTVGQQNLGALLGVQQLGTQTGLQAALANQQAQEFGAGQQLQASLANQQAGMQAALANQQSGLQAGLAAQQMGLQGAEFGAGQGLQAGLANQAAAMQALGLQYQGGLQGALQTQQLGMQGLETGAQMGLQSAWQQEQLRQAQMGMNLQAGAQQMGVVSGLGALGAQGEQNQIAALNAMAAPAQTQQSMAQQQADAAYQYWLQQQMMPFQAGQYEASIMGMQPTPSTATWGSGTTTGTLTPAQPSIFSSVLGGALAGAGLFGGLRKGGMVKDRYQSGGLAETQPANPYLQPPATNLPGFDSTLSGLMRSGLVAPSGGRMDLRRVYPRMPVTERARGGLAAVPKRHHDAVQDRAQVLDILRERNLIKNRGGLAAARRAA